jgi:hypothetical protein
MTVNPNESSTLYPRTIRFKYAMREAYRLLRQLGNPISPIKSIDIAKHLNFMVDYSPCKGPDGYSLKIHTSKGPRIVIRIATDVGEGLPLWKIERMQNWTLAHEIGHILMHGSLPWNTLKKDYLPKEASNILEVEAHWFASRLLMPNYVFVSQEDLVPEFLAEKCSVNYTAAQKRLKNLDRSIIQKLQGNPPVSIELVRAIHYFSDPKRYICLICSNETANYSNFCAVCGTKKSIVEQISEKESKAEMIYDGFKFNENGYPTKCPQCENEELNGDEHCGICGAIVVNHCTRVEYDFHGDIENECGQIADGKSRFCTKCGEETTYFKQGFLRPWEEVKRQIEELEEMFR